MQLSLEFCETVYNVHRTHAIIYIPKIFSLAKHLKQIRPTHLIRRINFFHTFIKHTLYCTYDDITNRSKLALFAVFWHPHICLHIAPQGMNPDIRLYLGGLTWADIDMGRDRHGPRSTWAEVDGPRSMWAEIDLIPNKLSLIERLLTGKVGTVRVNARRFCAPWT